MIKLFAVSICIGKGDALEAVADNRRHFDRWIVVTFASDAKTHEVCRYYGIECHDGPQVEAFEENNLVSDNKAKLIEWGIKLISRDAGSLSQTENEDQWCVVMDVGLLLPRHFSERIRAMHLEAGIHYELAGVGCCRNRRQFESLRDCEPWTARVRQAPWQFALFALGHSGNRAPESRGRALPFAAIHFDPCRWDGKEEPCMGVSSDNSAAGSVDSPINAQRDGVAAVIGYFPGGRWREFAEQYARLILVDQFQIHAGSEDALVEADRRMLCRLFEEDGSNADGIEKFGESGSRETNLIPDGSLELLYISGEVSPASLYVALPYWLPKVRDGGTICGDAYGYLHSPDTTYTIALLIGVPENVDHRGRWKKSHRAGARLFLPMEGSHAKKCDGVLLVGGETGSLLLSAHAIRKHWNGPVHLWHQGPGDESLRIVCNRLGMDFVPISPAIVPVSELLNNDAISVPFDRTLILKPGHLLIGPPQFDMVTKALLLDESGPMIAVRERGRVDFRQAASVLASRFIGRENASIIVSDGEPEGWSEAAWEMWCELETEATLSNVTDVRVAPGVTVVTIVTPEEAGDFQRNWLSWRFRAAEALVLLVDMDIDTFWIPQSEKARVLAVTEKQAADMAWLFALIARESANRRLLFVSPEASALPGAELWPDLTGAWRAVHFSPQARTSAAMTGNAFFPKACFALVHKDDLQEIASRAESSLPGEMARVFCEWAVSREKVEAKIRFSNVAGMGWRFPAIHHWKEGSGKSTQPAGHLLVTRGDGLIQLADDVVIITLPERFDRQRRIADMMNRENLWFRFVEGVRVTDKEIDPAEISEVRRQKFKVVAGFEKYLRGMVGCRRAHLRELELAKEKNLRSLLIIEDDMALEPGWLRTLQSAIKDLPAGWFQLHFSANEFRASAPVSSHLHRLSGARQTTAILYSRTGIGAALNCLRHSRLEIDQWMGDHLHPFGNSYVMNPQIAHQQGGVSDIMGFDRGITA